MRTISFSAERPRRRSCLADDGTQGANRHGRTVEWAEMTDADHDRFAPDVHPGVVPA